MDSYELQVISSFTSAVNKLEDLCYHGVLNSFSSTLNDSQVANLISSINVLREMQSNGLLSKLGNLDEVAQTISRSANSYELNELTAALNKLKTALDDDNVRTLKQVATTLDNQTLSTLTEFTRTLQLKGDLEIQGLNAFQSTAARLSNDVSTLGAYIMQMQKEIAELKNSSPDVRIRNYLDMLKDPELMASLGLTKKDIAYKIAEELNKLGLPISYIGDLMASDENAKQNKIVK